MFNIHRYYNTYSYPYWGYTDYAMMMRSCFCKKSYFRVLNTTGEPLDVQVNDILMSENLNGGEFTKYVKFPPGTYHVLIYDGNGGETIFESDIDIDFNLAYTGVISTVSNTDNDICILMVPEERQYHMSNNMSSFRLANLCVDSTDIVLYDSDGTVLFSDIKYGEVSCNIAVPSKEYKLYLKTPANILEYVIDAEPKKHYTLFLEGKQKDNSINIIVPEDGVNFLDLC